jgi:hypothetical protein
VPLDHTPRVAAAAGAGPSSVGEPRAPAFAPAAHRARPGASRDGANRPEGDTCPT